MSDEAKAQAMVENMRTMLAMLQRQAFILGHKLASGDAAARQDLRDTLEKIDLINRALSYGPPEKSFYEHAG